MHLVVQNLASYRHESRKGMPMIPVGTHLDLDLLDTTGSEFRLSRDTGNLAVFVYFMRAILCMQCNAHVRTLAAQAADFAAQNVDVVIVIPDTVEAAADAEGVRVAPAVWRCPH